jgi:hypothetical protein
MQAVEAAAWSTKWTVIDARCMMKMRTYGMQQYMHLRARSVLQTLLDTMHATRTEAPKGHAGSAACS